MTIETEKKYLIGMPSEALLSSLPSSEIEQIYIKTSGNYDGERVRRRVFADKTVYTRTGKRRLTAMSAVEDEKEITRDEFEALSQMIERGTSPVIKTRYVMPYRGYDYEIDVYPFWGDRAVMEVELPGEDAVFELPPEILILRDVTDDARYKNHALARSVPTEELFR